MSGEGAREIPRPPIGDAERILKICFVEALKAAERNNHKPGWVGMGLRRSLEKTDEEYLEWRAEVTKALQLSEASLDAWQTAMIARNRLEAFHEFGDLVWSMVMAMDDSGLFVKT